MGVRSAGALALVLVELLQLSAAAGSRRPGPGRPAFRVSSWWRSGAHLVIELVRGHHLDELHQLAGAPGPVDLEAAQLVRIEHGRPWPENAPRIEWGSRPPLTLPGAFVRLEGPLPARE